MSKHDHKTVLLVEDEPIIALAEKQAISRFGYEVVTANTGEKAVEIALSNEHVQLALMDIDLGKGFDGTEAAKKILSHRNIPIVFLTSHGEKEMVDRVRDITRYGYVIKNSGDFVLQSSIEMAFDLFNAHQITQAKMKALQQSESRLHFVSQWANDGIITADARGKIVGWNKGAETVFGYTEEEVIGHPLTEIMPHEYRKQHLKGIENVAHAGEHAMLGKTIELHGLHRRGRVFPLELSMEQWESSEGIFYTAILRDITERKLVEEALRESEERFRNLLQSIPTVAVQGYTMEGITNYWNTASERLYGYTAQEAIGRSLLDLIIPPEMRDDVRQAIRHMAETHESIPASELTLMRKDGSRVTVFSSHTIVYVPSRPPELFCLDIDISHRTQADASLQETEG